MARLFGECGSICYAGKVYLPGPDGSFEVPNEAAATLASHGLSRNPPPGWLPPEQAATESTQAPPVGVEPAISPAEPVASTDAAPVPTPTTPASEPRKRRRG